MYHRAPDLQVDLLVQSIEVYTALSSLLYRSTINNSIIVLFFVILWNLACFSPSHERVAGDHVSFISPREEIADTESGCAGRLQQAKER